ncbi:unnamed protein product [Effrenium voratum]|uniref:Uncharacterized protein n=1 Tax=Effrenium voratum TaxID=2562239 RepID=A0AA36JCS0_9DINO|nr:unnamed protein product [Effrenium voratum]
MGFRAKELKHGAADAVRANSLRLFRPEERAWMGRSRAAAQLFRARWASRTALALTATGPLLRPGELPKLWVQQITGAGSRNSGSFCLSPLPVGVTPRGPWLLARKFMLPEVDLRQQTRALKALGERSQWQEAWTYLQEMRRWVRPDVVLFNCCIRASQRGRRWRQAAAQLRAIAVQSLEPSAASFNCAPRWRPALRI